MIYLPRAYMADLFDVDWAEVCITSSAEVVLLNEGDSAPLSAFKLQDDIGIGVVVEKAAGHQMRALVEDPADGRRRRRIS